MPRAGADQAALMPKKKARHRCRARCILARILAE
jgi:hypothetical protein